MDQGGFCPASAFTSIAAAFATQGYWVQADLLDMLTVSKMAAIGPLLYVCAAIGGLAAVAIGQPPRTYMWFFLGPALYGWLLQTRQEVNGVQWQVGMMQQDQRQVWKQAEVGLLNTNYAKRLEQYAGGANISSTDPPEAVDVANFFVWYDSTISSVVNALVDWAGPYTMMSNYAGALGSSSNVGGDTYIDSSSQKEDKWFLLSNLKWEYLQNITAAKLHDPAIRDAFATFIGGICGEQMQAAIDQGAFSAAAYGDESGNAPHTVFKTGGTVADLSDDNNNMGYLLYKLSEQSTDYVNNPIRKLFTSSDDRTLYAGPTLGGEILSVSPTGSFENAISWAGGSEWLRAIGGVTEETINCPGYLNLIVEAFRWESGHIYGQLIAGLPDVSVDGGFDGTPEDMQAQAQRLVRNLFYGWDIKKKDTRSPDDPGTGEQLTGEEAENFLKNLILVHLFKNEMAIVSQPVDVRYTGSFLSGRDNRIQVRTTGGISKFSEVYTWAKLMPYLQGVLLYYLAMGYPFACILMLIPGWHKALFTWMSFWAWVKLWDVGFALVMALERSIWAMIGNTSHAAALNDRIVEMNEWGNIDAKPSGDCSVSGAGCQVWDVVLRSGPGGSAAPQENFTDSLHMLRNFRVFDQALSIGPSLDLDLSNSYYIYIMSALYFAVPAIVGQIVLGAKSGVGSMMTQALSQNATEAGRASGTGFSSQLQNQLGANSSSIGQAAKAANLQRTGLASAALDMGNRQATSGIESSLAGSMEKAADLSSQGAQIAAQRTGAQTGLMKSQLGAWTSTFSPGGAAGQGASGYMNKAERIMGAGIDGVATKAQMQGLDAQRQALDKKPELNAAGFRSGATASALGRGSGMMEQKAQYSADMAGWSAQNRMANQLGGAMAAAGVQSGVLSPGAKPGGMVGLAASGAAGKDAKDKASAFFDGSSIYGQINNAAGRVQSASTPPPSPPSTNKDLMNQALGGLGKGGGTMGTDAIAALRASGNKDAIALADSMQKLGSTMPGSSGPGSFQVPFLGPTVDPKDPNSGYQANGLPSAAKLKPQL